MVYSKGIHAETNELRCFSLHLKTRMMQFSVIHITILLLLYFNTLGSNTGKDIMS